MEIGGNKQEDGGTGLKHRGGYALIPQGAQDIKYPELPVSMKQLVLCMSWGMSSASC